ncbi:2Fe-2S iron-sulfur cluster-binding protein [uncultured Herbaspirillum sp.]|uniref:2Fe-2S iron-sulfur cluster-binding protein n=1 Tax=uncultured Herbaspirillum sp. TaxID=160236 RepID=UPI0025831DC0|nr:2Fe-2S iron-sulfur cluster-binding protein [uncultured Herbaspirillum sp.]
MELVVQPLGRALAVKAGDNLLDALQANGVPVSYSCRAGRCGTCRCKLIEGRVLESAGDAKLTNPGEGSHVLACMSVITESCVVEIPEPDEIVMHPARILKTTVVALEDLTHDIKRVVLKSNKPLSFSPGQYALLQFTPEHIRPYSMAGLPEDDTLEFHLRQVPGGRVTGYVFQQLKLGDQVRVSGPMGTAYLRKKHEGPLLCIAGGTGLAPVLSIVRAATALKMTNPIHLYFGVRSSRDLYGLDWLQALAHSNPNLHLHIVLATNEPGQRYRVGLVTDAVAADWQDLSGWRAYLCGAPPMVEAATLIAKSKGIAMEHIYADAFYASPN